MNNTQASGSVRKSCPTCSLTFIGNVSKCASDGTSLSYIPVPHPDATIVPGYRLIRATGFGGHANVYQAVELATGQLVAVKIVHSWLSKDKETVRRFNQEAELSSRCSSPNIASVTDFGVLTDGRPYLVMDYVEGANLNEVIDDHGPLPLKRALPIFIQMAQALSHMHGQSVIHRDIKPSNIMLTSNDDLQTEEEVAKLIDFGIAISLSQDDNDQVEEEKGTAVGSPAYMSPEQCLGDPLDQRSDIYSLGCVMYTMLAGRQPFNAMTGRELMLKHVMDQPKPLALPPDAISTQIQAIVVKTMSKNAGDRYYSALQLEKDLKDCYSLLQASDRAAENTIKAA